MRSQKPLFLTATALLCLSAFLFANSGVDTGADAEIEIPFQKFVLDNGLTLIVHEDHKAPIVAVNVWYHVGSKNEKLGKTGFAHLFEHLMFNGTEHYNDEYFKPLERVGATDLNGTTNKDRTNYFQNVPTSALDLALWMESDRMGHLLGVVTQEKLDEQRGVVQNEKRQGENQPYGRKIWHAISYASFPSNHPYSWETIGSMEDLDAASLEDVHEWFKEYYGAANAVLVIAGDVNGDEIKSKVEKYFGDIPAGPPIAKHDVWVPKRTGQHRQIMQDRVSQARIYKVWSIPQWGSAEGAYLDLVSDVLASGKTSRLYKRLVYDDQIATDVAAFPFLNEIAGQFVIWATAKPGDDLMKVEKAIDEELTRFLKTGPTPAELQRVKTEYRSNFIRGIERIGGFGGKSDILAMNEVYGGDAAFYKTTLARVKDATVQNLLASAQTYLSDGDFTLEVHSFPEYKTIVSDIDRSALPTPGDPPQAKFPELQRATLSNGMKIVLAERHAVPIINFELLLDAGYAADQFAIPGAADLAMDLLDEGTKTRTALQINEELANLGAQLRTGSDLDVSSVFLSTLKSNLDKSLNLYADVILNPSFPEADFKRLLQQQIAGIKREKTNPIQMALRVLPRLLYGKDHAYGNPLTGSGFEDSVTKLTRDDLAKYHASWFKPNHATLVVVGATTMSEVQPKLEKLFKTWTPGDVPKKNIGEVAHQPKSIVYLMDKPGAVQSTIIAGHVAPPKSDPNDIPIEMMNQILGGSFTSRINMNLREEKHWSYGSRSILADARGQRPFFVYAPVQTDKTKESMAEISKELNEILSSRPATPEELDKVQKNRVLQLPGSWETVNEVGGSVGEIVRYGLPDDYYQTLPTKINALALADINAAAKQVIHPQSLVWVVVGDRAKIEAGVKELNYGELWYIDGDGNVIQ